jgi:ankyrin repeat protein
MVNVACQGQESGMLHFRYIFIALSCLLVGLQLSCSGQPDAAVQKVNIDELPPEQLVFALMGHGDTGKLEQLLDAYPDLVHAKGNANITPLHAAASEGDAAAVKLLLDRGADREAPDDFGQTPRDMAKTQGKTAVLKLLEAE